MSLRRTWLYVFPLVFVLAVVGCRGSRPILEPLRPNVPPPVIVGPGGDIDDDNPIVVFRLKDYKDYRAICDIDEAKSFITIHPYNGTNLLDTGPITKKVSDLGGQLSNFRNEKEVRVKFDKVRWVDNFDVLISLYVIRKKSGEKSAGPIVVERHGLGVGYAGVRHEGKYWINDSGYLEIQLDVEGDNNRPDKDEKTQLYALYGNDGEYSSHVAASYETDSQPEPGKLKSIKSGRVETTIKYNFTGKIHVTTGIWVEIWHHTAGQKNDKDVLVRRYFQPAVTELTKGL